MWTAFGIMVGYASDLAFYYVPDKPNITGLNWRLMMSSAMLPAVIVCCFVFLCPESPRWYLSKGRHHAAYNSMCRLRYNKIQAARDLFYMSELLKAEEGIQMGQSKLLEIIRVPRNRRAALASEIVMFMQVSLPHATSYSSHLVSRTISNSAASTSSPTTAAVSSKTRASPKCPRSAHPWAGA